MAVFCSDAQSSSNNTIAQDVLYCGIRVTIPIKNLQTDYCNVNSGQLTCDDLLKKAAIASLITKRMAINAQNSAIGFVRNDTSLFKIFY